MSVALMVAILNNVSEVLKCYFYSVARLQMQYTDRVTLMQQNHDKSHTEIRPAEWQAKFVNGLRLHFKASILIFGRWISKSFY